MDNEEHNSAYLAGLLVVVFIVVAVLIASTVAAHAAVCPKETAEARITEIVTPQDKVEILDVDRLDLFLKNANDLYNIGWQAKQIAKVYVIEAEHKADNPHFQVEHLFFIDRDSCIACYQTTYKAVVDLLLSPKPCEVLGITCGT